MYLLVSAVIVFLIKLQQPRKWTSDISNTERIHICEAHLKLSLINPNISKYREFGESNVLVLGMTSKEVTLYQNMAQTFLLLYAITNEKTVRLMQIGMMPAAFKTYRPETLPNNSDRYTLLSLIYLE